jgi:phosphoglycolate phosphatase-like HAD superfamily hydrolase
VNGPVRAILWDFDDTLMATAATRWPALQAAGARLGVDVARDDIARHWGAPFSELIARLAPGVPVEIFLSCYREVLDAYPPWPTPGATRLLTAAASAGVHSCVVSGGRRELIERDLTTTGLRPLVARIWGDGDVAHAKPDPRAVDPALGWLARRGIGTGQVVAIGDHPRDRQLAWSHGLYFIAVLSGRSRAADFRVDQAAGRWQIVDSLDELLNSGWWARASERGPRRRHSPSAAERDADRPPIGQLGVAGVRRQAREDHCGGEGAVGDFGTPGTGDAFHVVG